ncbi:MAG: decaprenyl-phosphate phosphoribosyltransferase [Oscillochloris sp.]|nr:decaprenyl-phosphate phosphoribosyltransferase [Oscillochloris sp.]
MNNLSGEQAAMANRSGTRMFYHLLKAMRPRQWIKNTFVFAALAFSENRLWRFWDNPEPMLRALGAFICFCLAASAIYLVNDLADIEKDRAHPRKRMRPLASGALSPRSAIIATILLIVLAVPLALWVDSDNAGLDFGFLAVLLTYVVVQGFLYTYWLKNIVILDILIIAAGFVLRAVGGGAVIDVTITPWLLVCMGLLAIFLGIGKRRHELTLLEGGAGDHRRILAEYSVPMLDQMLAIVTASIIMAYSMTTYSAPVAPQEPYPMLMATIPFVIYAIFRYLYLIYQRGGGGAPEDLVLKDLPLASSIILWGITVLGVLAIF